MNHSFMPIVVEVMEQPAYDAWVQAKQALNDTAPTDEPTKLAATE
jgi:heme/copper-type cytochrome/quinol oxidase subunit 2